MITCSVGESADNSISLGRPNSLRTKAENLAILSDECYFDEKVYVEWQYWYFRLILLWLLLKMMVCRDHVNTQDEYLVGFRREGDSYPCRGTSCQLISMAASMIYWLVAGGLTFGWRDLYDSAVVTRRWMVVLRWPLTKLFVCRDDCSLLTNSVHFAWCKLWGCRDGHFQSFLFFFWENRANARSPEKKKNCRSACL